MAINSTSFTNTPQAGDDTFTSAVTGLTEDSLFITYLAVMANDLGGAAKTLYSLDDGTNSIGVLSASDLLTQDIVRTEALTTDRSAQGAKIWITADGKVGYDAHTLSSAFQDQLQHLSAGQFLTDTFTYAIRLGNGTLSWATATVQIAGVNDAPVVAGAVTGSALEDGSSVTLNALANASDVDAGATLSVTGVPASLPAGVSYDAATHSFTLDPSNTAFQHLAAGQTMDVVVNFGVFDGTATAPASVKFTVTGTNDAPVITSAAQSGAVSEGDGLPAASMSASGLVTFSDADTSDGHTLSVSVAAGHGTASVDADGTWHYTVADADAVNALAAGEQLGDTFTVKVDDGHGGVATQVVNITITGTNDAPALTGTQATLGAGTEDVSYTVSAANLLAGFTDVDGDTLSVSGLTADHGTAVQNIDGSWTITPSANFNGPVTLSYNVIDSNGGSVAASQSYSLAAVNDAPTGAATAVLAAGTEDTAYTVSAADLLQGFSDVDIATNGQVLSVSGLSASNGTAVQNIDGSWTITPTANFNGPVTLSYNVIDSNGGSVAGSQSYSLAAVNDAPTGAATAVLAAGTEDTAYTVSAADLLQGFSDVDTATNGQVLSVSGLSASNGTAVQNLDGSWTITPSANFNGPVTLSYNVVDSNGGSVAGSQSYSLAAINDAPTLTGTQATLAAGTEDVPYTVSAANLLAGFTDVDGDTLSVSGLTANHGTVVNNGDGTFTVTPTANYNGAVGLSYNVVDGHGGSVAASESFNLAAANDAPILTGTQATLAAGTEDVPYVVSAANLLAGFTDADGDTLSVSGLTANHGTVVDNGNGTFTVTPTANYNGSVGLSYNVVDGQGGSVAASESFNLAAVNDAPVAVNDVLYVSNNTNVVVIAVDALLANDTDIDGLNLTMLSVGGATSGIQNLTLNANGTVTFDSKNAGGESFTYVVSDNAGGTRTGTVAVNIVSTNGSATVDLHLNSYQAAYLDGGSNNDALTGGTAPDTFIGGAADDTLIGGAGNDTLRGGASNDTIDGGAGTDLLDFSDASGVVTFTLTQSSSNTNVNLSGVGLGTDTYKNMEGVIGSAFNDTLTGSSSNDVIRGGIGDDTIDGGAGTDLLDFSDASGAITFTLTQSSSNINVNLSGVLLGTDTYKNMEGVIGSAFDDKLTGSSGADVLKGGDGNDTILGGAGNDTIVGGSGADILTGGSASDTFMYLKTDAAAVDTITDFDAGVGGDMLGIGDLLSGYSAVNAAQFVSFRESGSNTIVSIDRDGAGGAFGLQDLVVLQGVTGLDFSTLIAHVDPTPLP